jgi:hypothetical protein
MELKLFEKSGVAIDEQPQGFREQTGGPFTVPWSDSYRCEEDDYDNNAETDTFDHN